MKDSKLVDYTMSGIFVVLTAVVIAASALLALDTFHVLTGSSGALEGYPFNADPGYQSQSANSYLMNNGLWLASYMSALIVALALNARYRLFSLVVLSVPLISSLLFAFWLFGGR